MQIERLLGIGEGVTTAEELAWAARRFLAARRGRGRSSSSSTTSSGRNRRCSTCSPACRRPSRACRCSCAASRARSCSRRGPSGRSRVRLEPLGAAELDELLGELGVPPEERGALARRRPATPSSPRSWWSGRASGTMRPAAARHAERAARRPPRPPRRPGAGRARARRDRGRGLPSRGRRRAVRPRCPSVRARPAGSPRAPRPLRPATGSLAGEAAFRFKHILVREAAYRATAKRLRAVLHERLADGWSGSSATA